MDDLSPQLPHITTMPVGDGWISLCSEHGPLGTVWVSEAYAGIGSMGHAAAHHRG